MLKKILVLLLIISFAVKAMVFAGIGNVKTVVEEKALSLYDKNYKPEFIQEIKLDAAQILLSNGVMCKHAGFGATIGFKGKRLNYTCEGDAGLIGSLLLDKNGNLFAEHVEYEYAKSKDPYQPDWKLIKSEMIRVEEISWSFEKLREEFVGFAADADIKSK